MGHTGCTQYILTTTRKKSSSETWRAILFGRQALLKGLNKRIGPGDSIHILEDKWIAGTSSMKPLFRLPDVRECISNPFIPGTRQWDEALVRNTFCATNAEEILKLKPGVRMDEDIEAWAFKRNRLYSVRSCYRMLKHESAHNEVQNK
jgi:hypothetical protein